MHLIIYRLGLDPLYDEFSSKIQHAFNRYGCNIRTLHDILVGGDKEAVKSRIRETIAGINLSAVQKMVETGSEPSEHMPYSIIQTSCPHQPEPGDVNYYQSDDMERSISSYAVWKALYKRYGRLLLAQQACEKLSGDLLNRFKYYVLPLEHDGGEYCRRQRTYEN